MKKTMKLMLVLSFFISFFCEGEEVANSSKKEINVNIYKENIEKIKSIMNSDYRYEVLLTFNGDGSRNGSEYGAQYIVDLNNERKALYLNKILMSSKPSLIPALRMNAYPLQVISVALSIRGLDSKQNDIKVSILITQYQMFWNSKIVKNQFFSKELILLILEDMKYYPDTKKISDYLLDGLSHVEEHDEYFIDK